MNQPSLVDGKKLAESILDNLSLQKVPKKLISIVIGDDPLSHKFVDLKGSAAAKIGLKFEKKAYPQDFHPPKIIDFIRQMNADKEVSGIMVQLPLPSGLNQLEILKSVHPFKDVDCLHPKNIGLLLEGTFTYLPPVVLATLEVIRSINKYPEKQIGYLGHLINIPDLKGVPITILGGGLLVGKPLTAFLLNQRATVTVVNEFTPDLAKFTKDSSIVITGTNQKNVLQAEQISDGSLLIDIGNDVDSPLFAEKSIDFCKNPGGIGPLTIAYLLFNTVYSKSD